MFSTVTTGELNLDLSLILSGPDDLFQMLTLRIRRGVKDLDFSRYRFVVHVTIGQLKRQCFQISSRFLWDHKIDGFATENFMNDTLFATCVVYAVYYE